MTTFKNNMAGAGAALIALVSLALPFSFVQASEFESFDFYPEAESYDFYPEQYEQSYDFYPDQGEQSYDFYPDQAQSYDFYPDSTGSYGGTSFGGGSSGSGFKMPSFGGMSSANQQYRTGGGYPVFPNYPQQPVKPSNTTVTTNTCVNNSCNYTDNSIVDNSVKVSNSFNNQKQKKEEYRNDCYGYDQGYNTQYGYGQQDYGYGYDQGYNYNDCYVAPPIAYNTTPYITLSQAPYTGLDLGPMGEVLYWTFLVLWCLGAAYLIVVKRVQNKLVGFLNGFLFGTAATKVAAHTTHAPAHTHAAASAPLVEEGIDSFIQSQIKRS